MKQKLLLLMSIFFALMMIGCSETVNEEPESKLSQAEIIVVIDEISDNHQVEFIDGTSLMEIMKENFEIETAFEDSFIIGINEVLADDEAKLGWMYYINGDFATSGANDYIPEDGDVVEFKYESWE